MTVLWHLFRFSWKNPVPNLPHCQCKLYVNHVGKLTETYHLCILRCSYNNILPKKKTISVTEESQEKPSSFIIPWSDSVTRRSFFSPGKKKKSLHLCSVSSASNGIHCSSVICVFFMLITHKSCLREAEEGRTGLGGVGGFSGRQPPGSFVTADEWATPTNK